MMDTPISGAYRYPGGSQSFQDTDLDRKVFFGRDREKEELLHLILAEKLVVLFARSGMGKTSLLNAGILQALRQRGLFPLSIRVNDPRAKDPEFDLLGSLYQSIERQAQQQHIEFTPGVTDSLWHYFKTVECWSAQNTLLTPVLILDQFEDFFDFHGPDRRRMLSTQMAALLKGAVPEDIQTAIESGAATPYTSTPPNIKVLISLREDYLGQLEELAQDVPEILLNRYRLVALHPQDAEQAIIQPAALTDEHFATHRFEYHPEAVAAMLDFLSTRKERQRSRSGDAIEPFQLQLLCQHIEKTVRDRQHAETEVIVVQKSDLGGENAMQRVLERFYDDQIRRLRSPWKKWCVRRLCEKGLSSSTGRRLSMEEEEIARRFYVPAGLLKELVNQRLLRAEPRVGSVYYELSHDTLVEPIRNSQRKRLFRTSMISGLIVLIFFVVALTVVLWLPTLRFLLFPNAQAQYQYGLRLYSDGKHRAAIQQFENVLDQEQHKSTLSAGLLTEVYFTTGIAWYHSQEPARLEHATRYLRQVLKDAPNHIQAHQSLGVIHLEQTDCAEAVASFQKVRELERESATICYHLAQAYMCQGNQADARQYAVKAFLYEPQKVVTRQLAEQYSGEPVAKVRSLLEAIQNNPWESRPYNNLAELFIEHKQFNDAVAIFEIAANRLPTAFDLYYNWGRVYYYQEQHEKALEYYQKAVAGDPQNYLFANNLGYAFVKLKRNSEAIEQFQKVIALAPQFPNAYHGWGLSLYQQGEYKGAIEQLQKALKWAPRYANAWYTLGQVYRAQGKQDAAEDAFTQILECQPRDVSVYAELGTMYTREGQPERAVQFIKKIVELRPDEADAYYERGILYKELGMVAEAYADFSEAIRRNSRQKAEAYYWLGQIVLDRGQPADAETYLQQAIALKSQNTVAAHYFLGRSLYAQNRHAEAIAALTQVIGQTSPFAKDAAYYQGLAFKAQANSIEALQAFQQAIDGASQYTAAAYYESGVIFCQNLEYDKAFRYLTEAFWRDPGNASYYEAFDGCLPESGEEASQAIRDALATLHQSPDDLVAYNDVLLTLLRYNHVQEALFISEKVLTVLAGQVSAGQSVSPDAHRTYYALGWLNASLKRYDEACTWYLRAFVLQPENGEYYEALRQIWPEQKIFSESIEEAAHDLHTHVQQSTRVLVSERTAPGDASDDPEAADYLQSLREALNQSTQAVGVGQ